MKYRVLLYIFLCLAVVLTSCIPRRSNTSTNPPVPQPVIKAFKLNGIGNRTYTEGDNIIIQTSANRNEYTLTLTPESFLKAEGTKLVGTAAKGFLEGTYTLTATANNGDTDTIEFNLFVKKKTVQVVEPIEPQPPTEPEPQSNTTSINTLPVNNGIIIVPEDTEITLDSDLDIRALEVKGKLVCADIDLSIKVSYVFIDPTGTWECGSTEKPYTHNLELILRGGLTSDDIEMGTHFIAVRGVLSLHGKPVKTWTRLGTNATKGATEITLSEDMNWSSGDVIAISSSSINPNEAEQRTIKSVSGKTVTLNRALDYAHDGTVETKTFNNRTWTVDDRAAVGLLTRNITITAMNGNRFVGGHVMTMGSGKQYIQDIALRNMGWADETNGKLRPRIARYPIHWHELGNADGQYFKDSAVIDSNHRCVVIHDTNNVEVSGNVCIRFLGHGYFLEDGTEVGNTITGNLGMLGMRPSGDAVLETDTRRSQTSRGPAIFWLANTNNTVENNYASSTEGTAYWYFTETPAHSTRFGTFKNNTATASSMAYSSCKNPSGGQGMKQTSNEVLIQDFTVSTSGFNSRASNGSMATSSAIWPCDHIQTFNRLVVSDSGGDVLNGTAFASQNSIFVTPTPMDITNSLFLNSDRHERVAFGLYDAGVNISGSHFEGFTANSAVFGTVDASTKRTDNRVSTTTFSPNSNMLMTNVNNANAVVSHTLQGGASRVGSVVHDLDGSLARAMNVQVKSPAALVVNQGLMSDSSCVPRGQYSLCPYRYGNLRVVPILKNGTVDGSYMPLGRTIYNGLNGTNYSMLSQPVRPWIQRSVRVNTNTVYMFDSPKITQAVNSSGNSIRVVLRFVHSGDSVIVGIKNVPNKAIAGYPKRASLVQLKASDRGYFYGGGVLYVKGVARGAAWNASFSFVVN